MKSVVGMLTKVYGPDECTVALILVLLVENDKGPMNHPAGPFVCPYCSASRKRAHESAWGYFSRCSLTVSQVVCEATV